MCEGCSRQQVERRCPGCRPQYSPAAQAERRGNAVRRAPFVRCQGCGYHGPRFDRHEPIPWYFAALILLGCAWGAILGVVLMSRLAKVSQVCPGCGGQDLVPGDGAALSPGAPDRWQAASEGNRAAQRFNRLLLLTGAAVALMSMGWMLATLLEDERRPSGW